MTAVVKNLSARDIPSVLEISVECGLCLWSAEAYLSELTRDDSIMLKLTGDDHPVVGFAVGRIFDLGSNGFTVELTNIGLRKTFRNQGLGTKLLKAFIEKCRSAAVSAVVLEVRVSNSSAISFYKNNGFRSTGRRRRFYSNPLEDGITMRLILRD